MWGALNPASLLRGLIDDDVPSQAAVEGVTVQLGWVDAWIPPILGAGLICAGLAKAADELTYAPELPGTRASTVGWAAAVGAGLLLATALVVGITVLLIRTGVSRPAKRVADTQVLGTALAFPLWHILDAIHGLSIPQTLNWQLAHDLNDVWSGAVLLLYKAILLFALIFVTSRIVQPHLQSRLSAGPGALAAASIFDTLARQAGERFDEYERDHMTGHFRPLGEDTKALVDRVERASTDVHALFGSGHVTEHADRIVAMIEQRRHRMLPFTAEKIEADRAAFDVELTNFGKAARRTLRTALQPEPRRRRATTS